MHVAAFLMFIGLFKDFNLTFVRNKYLNMLVSSAKRTNLPKSRIHFWRGSHHSHMKDMTVGAPCRQTAGICDGLKLVRSNDVPAGFTNLKMVSSGKEQDKGHFQDQLQDAVTVGKSTIYLII